MSTRQLMALVRGSISEERLSAALRHLLGGCASCTDDLSHFVVQARLPAAPRLVDDQYFGAIQRAWRRAQQQAESLAQEEAAAGERLGRLIEQPRRQQLMLRNSSRYRSPSLCRSLMQRSFEERFRDAPLMLRLAELAVQVAESLDDSALTPARLADLRAEAWAYLANARRVSSDLPAADEAFESAFENLDHGVGDMHLRARILTLVASLRGDQRRFSECTSALQVACSLYRSLGEDHLLGRTLILRGSYEGVANELEPASGIELLIEGLGLVECRREPSLVVLAMHNLVSFTATSGRHCEAWQLLRECRGLYQRHLGRLARLKLLWLEGMLAAGLGLYDEAVPALTRVRLRFQAQGMGYDVALVGLDLALVELYRDRPLAARIVVEEAFQLLRAEGIGREALAALLLLRRALRAQRRPIELLQGVMAFLRHHEIDSKARFRRRPAKR